MAHNHDFCTQLFSSIGNNSGIYAGNILTRSADGVTTQPIEGQSLLKLWQDRKLPIDNK